MEKNLEFRVSWWNTPLQKEEASVFETLEQAQAEFREIKQMEIKHSGRIYRLPSIEKREVGKWKSLDD